MPNFRERGGSLEVEAANGTTDGTLIGQMMESLNEMSLYSQRDYDQANLERRMRFFQESIDKLNKLFLKETSNRTRPPPVYLDVYNLLTEQLHKCQEMLLKLQLQQAKASDDLNEAITLNRRPKINSTSVLINDNNLEDEHVVNSNARDNRTPITLTESDNEDDDLMKSLRDLNLISKDKITSSHQSTQSITNRPQQQQPSHTLPPLPSSHSIVDSHIQVNTNTNENSGKLNL